MMKSLMQLSVVLMVAGSFILSEELGKIPAFGIFVLVFGICNLLMPIE